MMKIENLTSMTDSEEEEELLDILRQTLSQRHPDLSKGLKDAIRVVVRSRESGELSEDHADQLLSLLLAKYMENVILDQVSHYFGHSMAAPFVLQRKESRIGHAR